MGGFQRETLWIKGFDDEDWNMGSPFLTHYRPAMTFGNKNLECLFISVLSQFKKYYPPWKPEIL